MVLRNRKTGKPHEPRTDRGLECPACACRDFRVVYTRPLSDGRIERRRECRHCQRRVTTYEILAF